jgi:ATP-binding cassette subfamily B protein
MTVEVNEKVNGEEAPAVESMMDDSNGKSGETAHEENDEETPADSNAKKKEIQDEDSSPPLPPFTKLILLAKPEFPQLFVACIFMIGAEAVGLVSPLILAQAYDTLVDPTIPQEDKMPDISHTVITVLILHFSGVVGQFLRGSIMGAAGERVVARLRNSLYTAILKQEISFFDEHKTGELVSRLGSDTTLVQEATSMALPQCILGVVKLCVSVALMFWISAKLAGITLGSVIVIFFFAVPFGKLIGALSKAYQDVLGEAQTRSTEALGAMRTVQAFAAEERESRRYLDKIGDPAVYKFWYPCDHREHKTTYSVGFFKSIVGTGFFTFIFGVGFGCMYISLWYGFKLLVDGEISLGDLTAFQSYIFQIGFGLAETSRYLTQLIEARGASGRIFFLLERVPSIPTPQLKGDDSKDGKGFSSLEKPLTPSFMNGDIEFRNVSFVYPSRPDVVVLQDFNLRVPANTTAALVGSSGAGKSTVVSLLQRLYDVDSGSIRIDGNDIRSLDLQWMRSQIGYVQQEPQLFGLTVRENVCYGVDRHVTDEEIETACKVSTDMAQRMSRANDVC